MPMSDDLNDLPKYPDQKHEPGLRRRDDPPDRFIDRLRHAWPVYLIFGGLFALWGMAVVVLAVARPGSGLFIGVLMLPAVAALRAGRWLRWRRRD
jgi:hypothetical protein